MPKSANRCGSPGEARGAGRVALRLIIQFEAKLKPRLPDGLIEKIRRDLEALSVRGEGAILLEKCLWDVICGTRPGRQQAGLKKIHYLNLHCFRSQPRIAERLAAQVPVCGRTAPLARKSKKKWVEPEIVSLSSTVSRRTAGMPHHHESSDVAAKSAALLQAKGRRAVPPAGLTARAALGPSAPASAPEKPTPEEVEAFVLRRLEGCTGVPAGRIPRASELQKAPLSLGDGDFNDLTKKLNRYVRENTAGAKGVKKSEVAKAGLTVDGLIKLIQAKVS